MTAGGERRILDGLAYLVLALVYLGFLLIALRDGLIWLGVD